MRLSIGYTIVLRLKESSRQSRSSIFYCRRADCWEEGTRGHNCKISFCLADVTTFESLTHQSGTLCDIVQLVNWSYHNIMCLEMWRVLMHLMYTKLWGTLGLSARSTHPKICGLFFYSGRAPKHPILDQKTCHTISFKRQTWNYMCINIQHASSYLGRILGQWAG